MKLRSLGIPSGAIAPLALSDQKLVDLQLLSESVANQEINESVEPAASSADSSAATMKDDCKLLSYHM
jgi:hypothetical protein